MMNTWLHTQVYYTLYIEENVLYAESLLSLPEFELGISTWLLVLVIGVREKVAEKKKEAKEFMGKCKTSSDHNVVKQDQLDGIFRKC